MIRRDPTTPGAAGLHSEFMLQMALVRLAHIFSEKPTKVVVERQRVEITRHVIDAFQHVGGPFTHNCAHDNGRQRHAVRATQFKEGLYSFARRFEGSLTADFVVCLLVAVDREQEDEVSYSCELIQMRFE